MKTILLPTDFSNNSLNAINFGMKMLKDVECKFFVLNVQKASSFVTDDLMTASPSVNLYQSIIDTAKKSLLNLISKITTTYNNPKHQLIPIVDYDNFIDAINQISEVNKIDLILMGTKGASGVGKIIFGSNTVRVMQRGIVPVLAIPNDYDYKPLDSVVFISNYSKEYNKNELIRLFDIVSLFNSNVDILHVSKENDITEEQKLTQIELAKLMIGIPHKFVELKGDNIFQLVNDYIKNNKINLLTMTNKRHSFLERFLTTHKVESFGFNTEIPFLVMPKQ